MKKILMVATLLCLSGCHDQLRGTPQGNLDRGRLACRDGVEYLQFNNNYGDSFTAHLKPDGKPYTC